MASIHINWPIAACKSSSRVPDTIFWPLRALAYTFKHPPHTLFLLTQVGTERVVGLSQAGINWQSKQRMLDASSSLNLRVYLDIYLSRELLGLLSVLLRDMQYFQIPQFFRADCIKGILQ